MTVVDRLLGARSLLFAPGDDARKVARALESEADAVVVDLEDAVAPEAKAGARSALAERLGQCAADAVVLVRVNAAETRWCAEDWAAVSELDLAGVVLPKATPAALDAVPAAGPPVLALVESAAGLRAAFAVAAHPRVAGLALGAVDLGAELGLEPSADGQELLFARSSLVVDSAAAGARRPIDAPYVADVRDAAGVEAEARRARSLGFGGKLCVHPAQVEPVNRAFAPTSEQLVGAQAVLQAAEAGRRDGRGAVALAGEMIDLPVLERARSLLAEAERRGR